MTGSTIGVVKIAEMRRRLHEESALSDWFRSHLLTRNNQIEADLVDQLFNRCEKRLARALLLLAHFDKHDAPRYALPTISRNAPRRDDRDDAVQGRRPDEQISEARIPRAPQRTERRPSRSLLDAERPAAGLNPRLQQRGLPSPRYILALVVQDNGQERAVHLDIAVVFDEPEVPELVHEEVDPRARRAHDFGERFLR